MPGWSRRISTSALSIATPSTWNGPKAPAARRRFPRSTRSPTWTRRRPLGRSFPDRPRSSPKPSSGWDGADRAKCVSLAYALREKNLRGAIMALDRRVFVTWAAGGAFVLAAGPLVYSRAGTPAPRGPLSPWLRIAPDGRVTLVSTVSEMGQGSRTGQAQILADELDVDWETVSVEMAPDSAPFRVDGGLYSGGSESIRTRYDILRAAGATARAQLIAAAAQRWSVPADSCQAALGRVTHAPSGRALDYGALAADAAAIPPPKAPPFKPPSQRRYIGRSLKTLGLSDKVTGAARYGIDVRLPGMAGATVRACPMFGGTLAGVDAAPAMKVAGVRRVVKLPAAVAVVADSTWAAFQGARAR